MLLWPWNRLNAVTVLRACVTRSNHSAGQESPHSSHATMTDFVDWSSNKTSAANTQSNQLRLTQNSQAL